MRILWFFFLIGGSFTLQELGLGEVTPPHGTLYRTDITLPHCGYSMTGENDADNEADCVLSPEPPVRLWTRNTKSGRSSCLSSRANSNLTLTDTEHENTENGKWMLQMTVCDMCMKSHDKMKQYPGQQQPSIFQMRTSEKNHWLYWLLWKAPTYLFNYSCPDWWIDSFGVRIHWINLFWVLLSENRWE